MMSEFLTFLKGRVSLLAAEWPFFRLEAMTNADATGAAFKLVSLTPDDVLIIVYVYPDGGFTSVFNPVVNKLIAHWIADARRTWNAQH